jgi:hypothetical protein
MASISFFAGEDFTINALAGSGIGFYGDDGFGTSVRVSEWQGRTFITDSTGTAEGPEVDNCKYVDPTGVVLGQAGAGILLSQIPNYLATLNIRFEHDEAVKVQNAQLQIYDRVDPDSPASGVTTAVYEVVHPGTGQSADGSGGPGNVLVSGEHSWYMFVGDTPTDPIDLSASPGTSGLSPSGEDTIDTRHDWFLALSASPDEIGSKLFGGFVSLEYL